MSVVNDVPEVTIGRVCVIYGAQQMDIAVPMSHPVLSWLPDVIAAASTRDPNAADISAEQWKRRWQVRALTGGPVPLDKSLLQAGVRDGEVLLLEQRLRATEPPMFDDVVAGTAEVLRAERQWRSQHARLLGLALASVLNVAVALALWSVSRSSPGPALVGAVVLGCLWMLVGLVLARFRPDPGAAAVAFVGSAVALCPAAAAPITGTGGPLHLVVCGAVLLCVAAVSARASADQRVVLVAVTLLAVGVVLIGGAGAHLLWQPTPVTLSVVGATAAVWFLLVAPRVAMVAARMPLPPVPTPGSELDPARGELDPVAGTDAIRTALLPSLVVLDERARRAAVMLRATVAVGSTTIGCALIVLCIHDHGRLAAGLAVVGGAVVALRGRHHSDPWAAGALVIAGCFSAAAPFGVAAVTGRPLWGAIGLITVTAVALTCGLVRVDAPPTWRRAGEIAECLLIAGLLPLAAAVLDLYVRLRHH